VSIINAFLCGLMCGLSRAWWLGDRPSQVDGGPSPVGPQRGSCTEKQLVGGLLFPVTRPPKVERRRCLTPHIATWSKPTA